MEVETMDNIPEFYILGLPVKTPIGIIYPIKVKQYLELAKYMQILSMEDWQFKQMINPESEIYDDIKDIHFFYIIKSLKDLWDSEENMFHQLYTHYKSLFQLCFHDDVFDLIETDEEFEEYRELIRGVNGIKHDPPNPNPEIEKYNQLKRLLDSKKGDTITFKAMYTSVLATTGNNPNELTMYQFNEVFERIGHFKSYDTTTLFKTVDADGKVEIQPWYGEAKVAEPKRMTEEQFNKAAQNGGNGLHEL